MSMAARPRPEPPAMSAWKARKSSATPFIVSRKSSSRRSLAEGGVDYAYDHDNEALIPPAMRAKVEQARSEIVAGRLQVGLPGTAP